MADDKPKTTAAQRAEEALGVAVRKVASLESKLGKLKGEVSDLEREIVAAKADRDYKALNPVLPKAVRDAHPIGKPEDTNGPSA